MSLDVLLGLVAGFFFGSGLTLWAVTMREGMRRRPEGTGAGRRALVEAYETEIREIKRRA